MRDESTRRLPDIPRLYFAEDNRAQLIAIAEFRSTESSGTDTNAVYRTESQMTRAARGAQLGSMRLTGASSIRTGQVVAFGISDKTPDGLLAKVESVSTDATGTNATLTTARITDVVPSGELDLNLTADPTAAPRARASANGSSGKAAQKQERALQCQNERSATAAVSAELSAGVRLSAKWTGVNLWKADPGHVKADVTGIVRAGLDGAVSLDGQATCELPVQGLFAAPIRLGVFTVQVGPVPVPVVIDGQINVSGAVTATGSIATSVSAQAAATAGVTYEQGKFTPHKSFDRSFNYTPPTVNGTGTASVTMAPTIGVKLAGAAGTEIDFSAGLKLAGNLNPPAGEPWWKLTAPMSLGARFTMDFWVINAESDRFELWSEEPVLAQADIAAGAPGSRIVDQGPSPTPLPKGVKTRLVWDSDTDVDLHTWDQYGNHAYFGDKDDIPSGYLDQDVIPGYGPETFYETDETSNTEYTFGVCQYSGYNSNVTVDVRDRDGNTRRFTVVLRGRKGAALLTTSPVGVTPYVEDDADWCSSTGDPTALGGVTTGSFN